jgi:hypothetical protein
MRLRPESPTIPDSTTHVLWTPPSPGSSRSVFPLRAPLIRDELNECLLSAVALSGHDWEWPTLPEISPKCSRVVTPRSQSTTGGGGNRRDDPPTRPPTDSPTRVSLWNLCSTDARPARAAASATMIKSGNFQTLMREPNCVREAVRQQTDIELRREHFDRVICGVYHLDESYRRL